MVLTSNPHANDEILELAIQRQAHTLISLDEKGQQDIQESWGKLCQRAQQDNRDWQNVSVPYHYQPIEDWKIAPGDLTAVFQTVWNGIEEGNRHFAMHCGSGCGRTGTVHAGLMLYEAMAEGLCREGLAFLDHLNQQEASVFSEHLKQGPVLTSHRVARAIEAARYGGIGAPMGLESQGTAVETVRDIETLNQLEQGLIAHLNDHIDELRSLVELKDQDGILKLLAGYQPGSSEVDKPEANEIG